jgi:hypothetical protein
LLAAEIHQSNRDKIHTWSGLVKVADSTILVYADEHRPDVVSEGEKHEIRFAARINPRMLKWEFRLNLERPDDGDSKQPVTAKGLVRDGEFTEVEVYDGKTPFRHISVNAEKHLSVGPTSNTFDPMYLFTDRGYDLAERFRFLHEQKNFDWKVERADPLMKVTFNGPVLNQYVVNLESGASLVRYEGRSPQGQEIWEWEHQKVGDVWVPHRLLYQNTKSNPPANDEGELRPILERTRMRQFEWTESRVNESIPDAEFTYASLGIKDGDRITNRVKGETYRYRAED